MYIKSIDFSIWCDFIERNFLDDEFETLINDEVINGATSNPAIFNQSFLNSAAYKDEIMSLHGKNPKEIYESLAIEDISKAAKKLLNSYNKDDDGFVSIEVDPFLANDTKKTVEEGRRLFKQIDKPNVMIKIPATQAGYEAMKILVSDGINVNATLIFSPEQAKKCIEAFKEGSNAFSKTYSNVKLPKCVISVFVSRFDRELDKTMKENNLPTGLVGIMNASKIYNIIEAEDLKNVRCLFASTGVKGDDLEKEYYVEKLLFPNAINTAPLDTIHAFIASGKTKVQVIPSNEKIEKFFKDIEKTVDIQKIYDKLMSEGMNAFEKAFEQILETLKN